MMRTSYDARHFWQGRSIVSPVRRSMDFLLRTKMVRAGYIAPQTDEMGCSAEEESGRRLASK